MLDTNKIKIYVLLFLNIFTWRMWEVRRPDAHHRVRPPVFHCHYARITGPSTLHITTQHCARASLVDKFVDTAQHWRRTQTHFSTFLCVRWHILLTVFYIWFTLIFSCFVSMLEFCRNLIILSETFKFFRRYNNPLFHIMSKDFNTFSSRVKRALIPTV